MIIFCKCIKAATKATFFTLVIQNFHKIDVKVLSIVHKMASRIILFCLIAVLVPTIIKSQDPFVVKELYQPIDVPSPSPINVIIPRVKYITTATPLQGYQGLFEILNVTNTGNIIEAYLMPDDHSFITGGILGPRIYKLVKLRFFVNQDPNSRSGNLVGGVGGPLEPTVIYRNSKYATFEEALKYPDGVVQLSFCVVTGLSFKSKFSFFQKTLGKIKEPGSSAPLFGTYTYMWFDHITEFKEYYAYRGSYIDMDTKKQYYGITQLIASPKIVGLSFNQFKAFQNLKGNDGKPFEAIAPIYNQGNRTVFRATGVHQLLHLI
ncbi:carbonic anhydrase 3-like [Planococcus citri]|uniref:carbonic anhydrase 3-like n=1 Tax=Planococcus citri TaxID=170843 RepID=UPI0031F78FB8